MNKQNEELFIKFHKLYWNLSRNMTYFWKDVFKNHFPGSQSDILFLLERSGPKRMSELADLLYLTPGAVTTSSNKLIENGYVSRYRDQDDRRVVYLEMTEKGKQMMTELQNEGRKSMKVVFNHLSNEDLEFFINMIEEASTNINNLRKGGNH
ncbi:MarR family winged helix-turn-helix transcriptional regulator [Virgibacillus soli]|uniref:MarR family transcriptional regulator n=1 Tax=Paracerasibacillus soli TaxID=480284 RepID=A0ABU5CNL6_9BACI|nr:MarR family transcriptional regulator [Virgibacillus soli]MDY0407953.1 MarR family transcriptional regulator [Virgibacillus soli]